MLRLRLSIIALLAVGVGLAAPSAALAAEGDDSGCAQVGRAGSQVSFRCRYGPVTVGPYAVRQVNQLTGVPKPALDGAIVHMSTNVTDRDGTPVPIQRLMLHHIVFGTLGRKDATCDTFTMFDSRTKLPALSQRFYGAGEERAQLFLPAGYGYPTKAADQWSMTWMFMNHRSRTDSAWITYDVTVDTAAGITPVLPHWLDVRNCRSDPVYDVAGGGKPGSIDTETRDYVMPSGGRIVAAGGHVHGGAKRLTVTEPGCGNRLIGHSDPMWGRRDDPFYNVRPVLHEPGPISMSGFLSATGVPVAKGERLRLSSIYDDELPHTRVMGIYVIYVAPDPKVTRCAPLPTDRVYGWTRTDGRRRAPRFRVPLTGLNASGQAVTIDRPPGATRVRSGDTTVAVGSNFLRARNLSIPLGASLTWRFATPPEALHNVTLANGPQGFSSPNLSDGRSFRRRFTRPGTYRYFCALHPVDMTGTIIVRPKGATAKRRS